VNRHILYSGWEVFTPDVGTVESMFCRACSSPMLVEKNINGATGMVEALSGNKHLHDRFTCPNAGLDWHTQMIKLKMLQIETPSATISDLLQDEINIIMCRKKPTK
jgi:hypothetical protein